MFKLTALLSLVALVAANPTPTVDPWLNDPFVKRDADAPVFEARAASCSFPSPPRTSVLSAPQYISGTFDGGNVRFERNTGCKEQQEGGEKDTVFVLRNGATLQNVVIGKNQMEGVYCLGSCTINNVWFEDVCEDAISGKGTGTVNVRGGGAKHAADKVIQHNGSGTINISNYCVQDFGKLYRSCGNCSSQTRRHVTVTDVIAQNGDTIAAVNSNYGDTATINRGSLNASNVKSICDTYRGVTGGSSPRLTRNQANSYCKF